MAQRDALCTNSLSFGSTWWQGGWYEGEWANGERHGTGVRLMRNGSIKVTTHRKSHLVRYSLSVVVSFRFVVRPVF